MPHSKIKWILIGAIIGAIISIPLFVGGIALDYKFCPQEKTKVMESAPGCEDFEGELEGTGGLFCEDGTIYRWGLSHCITKTVFPPLFPIISKLHPDMGLILIYLLPIYGAVFGILIVLVISLLAHLIKKRRK